jgi:hypothetical protein
MKNTLKPQLTGLSCVIRYILIHAVWGGGGVGRGRGGPSPLTSEAVGTSKCYINLLLLTPVRLFKIFSYIARHFIDFL